MKNLKFLVALTLLIASSPFFCKGQDPSLLGSWVKTKVELADGSFNDLTKRMDSMYIRYTFKENGEAFKSLLTELGMRVKYSLKGDIIEWNGQETKIEKVTAKNLVLLELNNGKITKNSTRLYLTRESEMWNDATFGPNDFYIVGDDTVYFQTERVYAVFNRESSSAYTLVGGLKKYVEQYLKTAEVKGFAYATFIIDIDGKIKDIKIQHHINEQFDADLVNAISRTEGLWLCPTVHDKAIKVLGEIKLSYQGQGIVRKTPNVTRMMWQCDLCSFKYQKKFIAAIKYSLAKKYEKSIDELAGCLALVKDEANLNYHGSICFEKMNDIPNRNVCLEKVKSSNLKYLLK